jgi:hypothetical protein
MHLSWTLVTIVPQRAIQQPELVSEVSALGPRRGRAMIVYAISMFGTGQGHIGMGETPASRTVTIILCIVQSLYNGSRAES